jgi:hypothetical protein
MKIKSKEFTNPFEYRDALKELATRATKETGNDTYMNHIEELVTLYANGKQITGRELPNHLGTGEKLFMVVYLW